jgi:Putative phage tail protein
MSGFAGRNNKADTGHTKLAGMKVQTTTLGRCIPWLFGTNRVAPNVIQWDDFQAIEKKEKSGGKGGGGSTTSYEYKAAVIMGICRGPIVGVPRIWADKKKWTPATLALDVYTGTATQTPHPHWATNHAAAALPYRGMAYAAKASMDLGAGGSVERHTFEVQTPSAINAATNPDARVDAVILAILTDKLDGVGIPAAKVGDLSQMAAFAGANGIFISPVYEDQRPAKDALARLAEIAQCGMYWSDGMLKFAPYSDTAAAGNGYTYAPASAAIHELTTDDFLASGDGPPIKTKRKGSADAKNHFQLKFSDRANEYNAATAESKDLGSIERFGLLSSDPEEFPEICVGRVAQSLADFRRDRAGSVRTTFEFRLSLRWDRLEPMDVVALTYAPDGYSQYTVRITAIEETDDGELMIEAEDCPLGAQHVVTASPQTPIGGGVDYNTAPGNASAPVIFEPPLSMTDGVPEIWIATSGGALWGGAEMHISTDGSTYQRVADVPTRARHGVLTAALPAGSVIDTANAAAVSLAVSSGSLSPGTTQDATDLNTLCWIDGEYIAYRDAALTGPNTYSLGYLIRGNKGSAIASHATGAKVVRLDDGVIRYPYDRQFIGRTIWVKFTSRNIFSAGFESLANVPAYSYAITGSALAGGMQASGNQLFNSDFGLQFRGWTPTAAGVDALRAVAHLRQHDRAAAGRERRQCGCLLRGMGRPGAGDRWRAVLRRGVHRRAPLQGGRLRLLLRRPRGHRRQQLRQRRRHREQRGRVRWRHAVRVQTHIRHFRCAGQRQDCAPRHPQVRHSGRSDRLVGVRVPGAVRGRADRHGDADRLERRTDRVRGRPERHVRSAGWIERRRAGGWRHDPVHRQRRRRGRHRISSCQHGPDCCHDSNDPACCHRG